MYSLNNLQNDHLGHCICFADVPKQRTLWTFSRDIVLKTILIQSVE